MVNMTEYMRPKRNGRAKLTDGQCHEIIARYQAGGISQAALGKEYGVCTPVICVIVNGKRKSLYPSEMPETKRCPGCDKAKPRVDFYESEYNRDGLASECKTCHGERGHRNYKKQSPETKMLNSAKHRAKKGGYALSITEEDIVIPARCPILGIELAKAEGCHADNSPTLDKIDPTLGYVPGNVQVISHKANSMKHNATAEELRLFAKWVLENVDGE